MDAVGLASSIISFIGVVHKVIHGSYEVYTSSTGLTEEHDHTARVVGDLNKIATTLKASQKDDSDQELAQLAGACCDLSEVLTQLLERFLPKGPGRLPAFVAACRMLRKKKEIIELEARLDRHGLQLSNASVRRIDQLETQLQQTLNSLQLLDESKESDPRSQQETLKSLVELNHKFDGLQQLESTRAQECEDKLEELSSAIQGLSILTNRMSLENQVLRRLIFSSIFQRENDVIDPSKNTFCWVFDAPQELDHLAPEATAGSNLTQNGSDEQALRLLMSQTLIAFLRRNAGTILLAGKAGCGKSTFMKYIAHHPTTKATLQEWAGDSKLVLVRVFFWKSDDAFQGSMVGFWRSVLFQILSQCPELVTKVFPQQHTDPAGIPDAMEFREPELETAFRRFLEHSQCGTYSFCCFIDGLDEHKGDNLSHKNMATLLSSWASQPSVKIICSSRPETVFLDEFRLTGTVAEFHKLNFGDITNFAEHKFITSLSTSQMQDAQRNCLALVHEIATRAEGVFLWATMAVRALINQALDHDDSEKALKRRLEECPDSLEALFQQMLRKVDGASSVQSRSNMALYLAVHNPFERPLNMLMFSWLDGLDWFQEERSFQASSNPNLAMETYTQERIYFEKERVDSLLHQVTRGLLEVVSVPDEVAYFQYRVDLFHRSVRDFLQGQWKLGIRENPFSNKLDEIRAYSRLRCLEIEGLVNQNLIPSTHSPHHDSNLQPQLAIKLISTYEGTFIWLAACSNSKRPPPRSCLEDFGAVLLRAEDTYSPFLLGSMRIDSQTSWRWHSRNAVNACSYVHWAAYWSQGQFVRSMHRAEAPDMKSGRHPADLDLLLSSSVAADLETTKYLLAHNHYPHDVIQISDHHLEPDSIENKADVVIEKVIAVPEGYTAAWATALQHTALWETTEHQMSNSVKATVSVWMVFLRDFATNVRSHCWKRRTSGSWPLYLDWGWLDRLAHIIEAYLKAGSDPEIFFLLCVGDSDKPFRVDLYQMLDIFKPDNLPTLGELLTRKPWWKGIWTRSIWTTPSSGLYQGVTTDTLLNDDWGILGVLSENGESLMGAFKVRVF
ncbi:hypothetical protein N0V82_003138 [Gnomoniopsis sp. IMI 355080]|nr:hypothetical protein N0V82_003138 [Gnomoniopsis sp. IMI 355080]